MVLLNQARGWRVTRHARGGEASGPAGRGSSFGLTGGGGGFSDRIQLGVLLGAGSFGRVYKGRWQGGRRQGTAGREL